MMRAAFWIFLLAGLACWAAAELGARDADLPDPTGSAD